MREGEKDGKRERRSVCVRERDRARESDDGERRGEEKRGRERNQKCVYPVSENDMACEMRLERQE